MVPPYFLGVGLLYLWAYWSSFGINILEFASLSDIVRVAIIPVGSAFLFMLLGFFIGEYSLPNLPHGGGRDTPVGKFLNKFKGIFIALYLLFSFFLIIISLPGKWLILPVWLMPVPYVLLKNSGFFEEIKNDSIRSLMIISLVALPIFSFCQGKINAGKVLTDSEYLYVQFPKQDEHMKYVGHINQMTFLISKDNQQIRIQKLEKEPLDLFKFDSKKDNAKPNKTISPER